MFSALVRLPEVLCRQVLAANKRHVEALALLGRVHQTDASHDEALVCFRQLVKLQAKSPHAHTMLGRSLLAAGRFGEALTRFDKALKLQPSMPEALAAKADAYIA